MQRLDRRARQRVFTALDRLVAHASGFGGDVKKLRGPSGFWRLRVGSVRVLFERDPDTLTILVVAVEPRGRAYRG